MNENNVAEEMHEEIVDNSLEEVERAMGHTDAALRACEFFKAHPERFKRAYSLKLESDRAYLEMVMAAASSDAAKKRVAARLEQNDSLAQRLAAL